jgi:predicted outer membrane lipoprotein
VCWGVFFADHPLRYTFIGMLISLVLIAIGFNDSAFLGFHVTSWGMGIGIAIDVFLATVGDFMNESLTFWNWTLPLSGLHVVLPFIGYYGFYEMIQHYPELSWILGTLAFVILAAFIYEVIASSAGYEPIFWLAPTAMISRAFGFKEDDARRFIALMAVSWDALWSGPAKSAAAEAGQWNDWEVGFSFIIAGIVVALVAQLGLVVAKALRQQKFANTQKLAERTYLGKQVELSVIGSFGVLSLLVGYSVSDSIVISLIVSTVIITSIFRVMRNQIMAEELKSAEKAINGEPDEETQAA